MELVVKHFQELTTRELYGILQARAAVFLLEQHIVCQDLDGKDLDALHVFLLDDGEIKAYLRVLKRGVSFPDVGIGRVLTRERGRGYGLTLMRGGMQAAVSRFGADRIRVEAQLYARGFYEKAGFRQVSGEFMDEGIPHVEMLWTREDA